MSFRMIFAIAAAAAFCTGAAYAQSTPQYGNVVASCGTPNGASYTTGQNRPVTIDTNGYYCTFGSITPSGTQDVSIRPSSSAVYAPSGYASASAESNHVVKNAAGNVYSVYAFSTAAGLLMTFNSVTVPGDGAVTPIECIPVAANSYAAHDLNDIPDQYGTGISVAFSTGTNCFNKAASATAFFRVRFQ